MQVSVSAEAPHSTPLPTRTPTRTRTSIPTVSGTPQKR